MENSTEIFFKKKKLELPCDPASLLLGIYLKKKKNEKANLKGYMDSSVHTIVIYNSHEMKAAINRWWITKMRYACNEILLNHKKERNVAIYNTMGGFGEHYAKWSKSEDGKYLYVITYI